MPRGSPKIKESPYEELIRRLIASGWSSMAISLYMLSRFGYELHDSTVRVYRLQHEAEIRQEYPELAVAGQQKVFVERALTSDAPVDVLGKLTELIRLQEARILVDVSHEETMNKLFSSTRSEVKVLADLLDQYHRTLQDWGVVPRAGAEVTVRIEEEQVAPIMLIDVMEEADVEAVVSFGRFVAEKTRALPSGNGHGRS